MLLGADGVALCSMWCVTFKNLRRSWQIIRVVATEVASPPSESRSKIQGGCKSNDCSGDVAAAAAIAILLADDAVFVVFVVSVVIGDDGDDSPTGKVEGDDVFAFASSADEGIDDADNDDELGLDAQSDADDDDEGASTASGCSRSVPSSDDSSDCCCCSLV